MAARAPAAGLDFEFEETPETGCTMPVADGVHWLRMPLPFALAHINLWLLEDGDGWVIVDSGLHVDESTAIWERTLAGVMQGRGVDRVVVTHMHPDHAGNAGWLCAKLGAELSMTRQEYLYCRVLMADTGKPPPAAGLDFYRAAGFAPEALHRYETTFGMFGRYIAPLPVSYSRITDGDTLGIGGREWQVIVGNGHSPEHACLFCPELGVLLSGDQVLPNISSNIGVWPTEPLADPLADWLASIDKLGKALPDDVLVLPAHGRPFRGVHARLTALRDEHLTGLERLQELCREPRRVIDTFSALFRRDIRPGELIMATGEAIAHLNYLRQRGEVEVETDSDGVNRYRST